MDIHFDCPHCTQPVQIDDSASGMQVECPNCQGAMLVPALIVQSPVLPEATVPTHQSPPTESASETQYVCTNPSCATFLTESELVPLEFRGKTAHVCPKCRRGVRKLSQPGSFWADVPKAFAYPLQGSGPWILIAGTPFLLLYDMLGFGLFTGIAKLVLLGVFGMLLQNVIRISSDEDGGTMEWPDTADKSEFITAGLQIVAVLLAVFAPAIACIVSSVFGFGQEYISSGVALILGVAFAIAGFVYFPMALLALAMFDTINVASPLVVIPAI